MTMTTQTAKTTETLRAEIAALVQQFADIAYASKPFLPGESVVPVSGKVIGAKELQMMVEALPPAASTLRSRNAWPNTWA
jgi:CDP-4-dehydro-6-deoxyglucose reductase, E1